MGQINWGYSDFQGQGNSGNMCGKKPELIMGTEELTFDVKQPVEGVKDFKGLDGIQAVGDVAQVANPAISEIQVELKKEWKMGRKPDQGNRRLQDATEVSSDSICIFDIKSDSEQKVTLDIESPHKYYLVNYTDNLSLTPIEYSEYEFLIKKSDQYDLIAIFQKESVPTTISYGALNEQRVSCTVRIDTDLASFETYGGEETFEKTIANEMGVDLKYIQVKDIRSGSVIVDYDIISDKNNLLSIDDMKKKHDEVLKLGNLDLGGTILSFKSGSDPEVIT